MQEPLLPEDGDKPPSQGFTIQTLADIDIDELRPVMPDEPPLSKLRSIHSPDDDLISIEKIIPSKEISLPEQRQEFIEKYFPQITIAQWNDWRWQLQNRIRTLAGLERIISLSDDERQAIVMHKGPLPVGITPYYASLLDAENPDQPLRRTVVKSTHENFLSPGEADDPLGEEDDMPIPGLVH